MPTYEYMCSNDHVHEARFSISERPEQHECPECKQMAKQVILTAPAIPSHIVIDYPGSKKHKAGYQHSHGDRKGTKIQSGYGGIITPSDTPKGSPDGAIWKNPLE